MASVGARWQTSKEIWRACSRVWGASPGLWVYPLLSGLIFLGMMLLAGGVVSYAMLQGWNPMLATLLVVPLMILLTPISYVATRLSAAHVVAVMGSFENENVRFSQAWAATKPFRGAIWKFALVGALVGGILAIVGVLLDKLRIIPGLGTIINMVGALGWATAAYFVIPLIVIRGETSVQAAIKQSVGLARKHWGKSVSAIMTISFVLFVPFMVLIIGGMTVMPFAMVAMVFSGIEPNPVLIGVFMTGTLILTMIPYLVLNQALQTTYQVALYRHVQYEEPTAGFGDDVLVAPWQ